MENSFVLEGDKMKSLLMILASGFEELEAIGVADVLKRLNFKVTLAGLDSKIVTGSHGITLVADEELAAVLDMPWDGVILPGGLPGAINLYNSELVIELLKRVANRGGVVSAICAAPIVLAKSGLLREKNFTMYPGFDKYLDGMSYTDSLSEQDGQIITGKGPGAIFDFAKSIAGFFGIDTTNLYNGMFVNNQ